MDSAKQQNYQRRLKKRAVSKKREDGSENSEFHNRPFFIFKILQNAKINIIIKDKEFWLVNRHKKLI